MKIVCQAHEKPRPTHRQVTSCRKHTITKRDIKTHYHHATPHARPLHASTRPTGCIEEAAKPQSRAAAAPTSAAAPPPAAVMATTGGGGAAAGGGGEGVILIRDEFLSLCLNHAEVRKGKRKGRTLGGCGFSLLLDSTSGSPLPPSPPPLHPLFHHSIRACATSNYGSTLLSDTCSWCPSSTAALPR
jgi:hypothetical protein